MLNPLRKQRKKTQHKIYNYRNSGTSNQSHLDYVYTVLAFPKKKRFSLHYSETKFRHIQGTLSVNPI